jgi:tetratricopeptide (TPR) repeat protein
LSEVSLLLEALKKAELAKQQNAAAQQGEPTVPAAESGLHLQPLAANSVEPPLITRDRLPDITQPLEILSEDLPSARVRRDAPAPPTRATAQPTTARPGPSLDLSERDTPTVLGPAQEDQQRASARQLFEAKSMDYDPRRPFFITLGVLAVVGVAAGGYFLYQIFVPHAGFYGEASASKATQPIAIAAAPATPPTPQAGLTPTAPAQAASTAPVAQPTPPVPPSLGQAPVQSAAATAQPTPAAGARESRPSASKSSSTDPGRSMSTATNPQASSAPRAAPSAASNITINAATQRLDPALERGWEALQAGDLSRAQEEYLHVLKANPLDRDALLGLATIDARNRDFNGAEARYLRVLEIDPRDPYAQAGIIALRGQSDPVQSESRLKTMLAQQPDATFLNFALGNQYALQSRWPDAQAAYFAAYSAEPENAAYALNLAVSLDHLRQPKLALEYYQRALALASSRTVVGFDKAQIETRIRELQR